MTSNVGRGVQCEVQVKCPLVLSLVLSSVTGPVVHAQNPTYCSNNHEVDL